MNQPKNHIEIKDGVATITIFKVNGETVCVLLDEADVELVKGRNLFAIPARIVYGEKHYIALWDKAAKKTIYLHHLLLRPEKGMQVDHIDRNPCNNLRSNLRVATIRQNAANKKAQPNKTGFRGVGEDHRCRSPRFNAFCAGIYVSRHDTAEDAARAVDAAAIKRFGKGFPMLNFPQEGA